jgi:hypothetical protein
MSMEGLTAQRQWDAKDAPGLVGGSAWLAEKDAPPEDPATPEPRLEKRAVQQVDSSEDPVTPKLLLEKRTTPQSGRSEPRPRWARHVANRRRQYASYQSLATNESPSPQYKPNPSAADEDEEEKEDVKKDVRTPEDSRSKATEEWFDQRNLLRKVAADNQARLAAGAPAAPTSRGGLGGSLNGPLNHTWYDGQFLVAARSADEADRRAYQEALRHKWFSHSNLVAARAGDIEDRKAFLAVQASGSPEDRRAFLAAQDDTQAIKELRDKRKKARKEMEARRQLLQPRPSPRYTAPPRSPSDGTEAAAAPSPRYTAPPRTPGTGGRMARTPGTGGRMASKTLLMLSLCTVVSPTDAVDGQSLLLPPHPPTHNVAVGGYGWRYLQEGQGGHTEVVWRVEGPPTRAAAADKKNAEPGSQRRTAAELNWPPAKNTTAELDAGQNQSSPVGWYTSPLTMNGTAELGSTQKATWPELEGDPNPKPVYDTSPRTAAATSEGDVYTDVALTLPKSTTTGWADPFVLRSPLCWAACAPNATLPGREPSHWPPPDLTPERRKRRRRKARGRRASSPAPGRASIYPLLLLCGGAGVLLLLVYTLAEGLGVRYQAGHSPFAQPVYYYPEGRVHLFTQSSTKSWPRRVAASYLRKKHPFDPRATGDGWILSDGRRVRDSIGGVHGSLYAWKSFLGIHKSYRVRYEGGVNHGREPRMVMLENQRSLAPLRALAQRPAEPTTESRPPGTVADQGPAMGAGGDRLHQDETLVAVALARFRQHHRQHQNELLFATALARLRHQHGGHLHPQPEPAPGASFGEADPEVEDDGLGAARSSDPSPRVHTTMTIDTPAGPTFRYSDAFSWQQVRAAFRGILWALARRHRAHRFAINGWSGVSPYEQVWTAWKRLYQGDDYQDERICRQPWWCESGEPVVNRFVDLYAHHLLVAGFSAYVSGGEGVRKFVMPDLSCGLVFEYLGMEVPPNETDYQSPLAKTTRAALIWLGAGVLGSLDIRRHLRERQRYLSAKAHLAPYLTRDKTLLIEIRLYSQVPPWQLSRNSALASRSLVNALKEYDIYDRKPRLMSTYSSDDPAGDGLHVIWRKVLIQLRKVAIGWHAVAMFRYQSILHMACLKARSDDRAKQLRAYARDGTLLRV